MKITLRKRNSVTSIVLFIYNLYGEYSGDYSISLDSLINYIQYFGKSESAIRMSLSRLVSSNIVENKKDGSRVIYHLTKEGLSNIESWNRGLSSFFNRYKLRTKQWNRQWKSIYLIDFNKSDQENKVVLEELVELGLGEVDNNLWISPYDMESEIKKVLADRSDINFLFLEGYISSNLSLSELVEKVYNLNELEKKYKDFIKQLEEKEGVIDEKYLSTGELLPILFELGWGFYDIVTSDPALPKNILVSWSGDQAVKKFRVLRGQLYSSITNLFAD